MRIVVLQMDIGWTDRAANLKKAEEMMSSCPGGDLYVLPEMFPTGFCMQPETVAEPAGEGPTLLWMKVQARAGNCAVAGSVPVCSKGRYYNRFYFVFPDGGVKWYDKRHLFAFGGEDRHYVPGTERVIVGFRGFRILLQVCYDLRFPVWSRCRGDYDLALYAANWPSVRREAWNVLLKARAIENQCYVAGVNRVGKDSACLYDGGSAVIDPYGRVSGICRDGREEVLAVDLDREKLDCFRQRFPVLLDADGFEMKPACKGGKLPV